MKKYSPIFATSTARSGSNMICMMLSTNSNIMLAADPYLFLFKFMRNAFMHNNAPESLKKVFDPKEPFQDYYFTDERIQMMDIIMNGDMTTFFDPQEWNDFLKMSIPRAKLQCAELVPYLNELKGKSYKEMFDNGLSVIAKARRAESRKWIGGKDPWTIEFFTSMARAYTDAKFIVILRDPRALLNSMLGVINKNPSMVGHALSYARHWRKYAAFVTHYKNDPLFDNRLFFVTHESVLNNPEKKAKEMCEFLEVDYEPAMLDTENYFEYATGKVWKGNSSFEENTSGISTHRAERWKTMLDPRVIKLVDFICGPEMKLIGFEPQTDFTVTLPDSDILEYLLESDKAYSDWRSDLGDIQKDYGFELFRYALLSSPNLPQDSNLIRRSFLFEDVFEACREKSLTACG